MRISHGSYFWLAVTCLPVAACSGANDSSSAGVAGAAGASVGVAGTFAAGGTTNNAGGGASGASSASVAGSGAAGASAVSEGGASGGGSVNGARGGEGGAGAAGAAGVGGGAGSAGSTAASPGAPESSPAGYGQGTTGGGNGKAVSVATLAALQAAIDGYSGSGGLVLEYTGKFDFTSIKDPCVQHTLPAQTLEIKNKSDIMLVGAACWCPGREKIARTAQALANTPSRSAISLLFWRTKPVRRGSCFE